MRVETHRLCPDEDDIVPHRQRGPLVRHPAPALEQGQISGMDPQGLRRHALVPELPGHCLRQDLDHGEALGAALPPNDVADVPDAGADGLAPVDGAGAPMLHGACSAPMLHSSSSSAPMLHGACSAPMLAPMLHGGRSLVKP